MESIAQLDAFAWERQLRDAGYACVAGVDEVGRGALAGPLVAAAVVLPEIAIEILAKSPWAMVRDSKTMTHQRRCEADGWIRSSGASISIAEVPCEEVDAIGIAAANRLAMEQAVVGLDLASDFLLIDAMTLDLSLPQIGIIDGDARCLSISAASIVAKVHRDLSMIAIDQTYPDYGFARHKGYGVAAHLRALAEHGPCPIHRQSFAPVRNVSVTVGHS
jgi:ribonuclease HII